MRYSGGGDYNTRLEGYEEVSPFMKNFLELKNKKEALLRSSAGIGTQMQTAGSTSSFSYEPNKFFTKKEEELKAAYIIQN